MKLFSSIFGSILVFFSMMFGGGYQDGMGDFYSGYDDSWGTRYEDRYDDGYYDRQDRYGKAAYRAPQRRNQPVNITIVINNFNFSRDAVNIPRDSRVSWINHDDKPYVLNCDGEFDGKVLYPGERYDNRFDRPGNYSYYSPDYPSMNGKVFVN